MPKVGAKGGVIRKTRQQGTEEQGHSRKRISGRNEKGSGELEREHPGIRSECEDEKEDGQRASR